MFVREQVALRKPWPAQPPRDRVAELPHFKIGPPVDHDGEEERRIELRGFGVFIVKPRKRGVGRNPRTGEEVAIPSGKTIRFKPGKELQAHDDDGDEVASD
jgi:transposase